MKMNEAPGARKKDEIFRASQTLDRVLADKRKNLLFSRFLNAHPADKDEVKDIYEKHKAEEAFTDDQIKLLNERLAQFRERMVLVEEARMLFGPKEIAQVAKGYEPLRELMSLNAKSPEMLQEYLAVMAMEKPDELRRMLDIKREINTKRRSAAHQLNDKMTDKILKRYKLSREDIDTVRDIADEGERKERFRELISEKAKGLQKALDYVRGRYSPNAIEGAYETLDQLQKDALVQEIEDQQRAIAGVIDPIVRGDEKFIEALIYFRSREKDEESSGETHGSWNHATKEIIRALGAEAGKFAEQEARWAGGIMDAVLKASTGLSFESGPHKGGGGEKKEKKEGKEKQKEKEETQDVEHFDKPSELYEAFFKRIKDKKDKEAEILLKENLTNDPKADEESRDIFSQVEKIMRKKKDGWQDKVKLILRVYLLGETEEEAEEAIKSGN